MKNRDMVFDYLIKGGLVVSGSNIRKVDVGIEGEKIVSVEVDLPSKEARQTIGACVRSLERNLLLSFAL